MEASSPPRHTAFASWMALRATSGRHTRCGVPRGPLRHAPRGGRDAKKFCLCCPATEWRGDQRQSGPVAVPVLWSSRRFFFHLPTVVRGHEEPTDDTSTLFFPPIATPLCGAGWPDANAQRSRHSLFDGEETAAVVETRNGGGVGRGDRFFQSCSPLRSGGSACAYTTVSLVLLVVSRALAAAPIMSLPFCCPDFVGQIHERQQKAKMMLLPGISDLDPPPNLAPPGGLFPAAASCSPPPLPSVPSSFRLRKSLSSKASSQRLWALTTCRRPSAALSLPSPPLSSSARSITSTRLTASGSSRRPSRSPATRA